MHVLYDLLISFLSVYCQEAHTGVQGEWYENVYWSTPCNNEKEGTS